MPCDQVELISGYNLVQHQKIIKVVHYIKKSEYNYLKR